MRQIVGTMAWYCAILAISLGHRASAADWPTWRGLHANGTGDYDGVLIEDAAKMRRVWKSEAVPNPEEAFCTMRTGYASPVVANGKVYIAYMIGDGKSADPKTLTDERNVRKCFQGLDEQQRQVVSSNLSDFVILAIDATTGKTAWKTIYESVNITMWATGKGGGHFHPCIAGDRLYVIDGLGYLCAVDAATGEKIYREALPMLGREREAYAAFKVGERDEIRSVGKDGSSNATPTYADGVIAYADNRQLVGVEAATGTVLWQLAENEIHDGPHTSICASRGYVYLICRDALGDKNKGYVLKVEAASGRIVQKRIENWDTKLCTSTVALADRLIRFSAPVNLRYFDVSGDRFDLLGKIHNRSDIQVTALTPAVCNGFLYTRGRDAIYCHDPRAK